MRARGEWERKKKSLSEKKVVGEYTEKFNRNGIVFTVLLSHRTEKGGNGVAFRNGGINTPGVASLSQLLSQHSAFVVNIWQTRYELADTDIVSIRS